MKTVLKTLLLGFLLIGQSALSKEDLSLRGQNDVVAPSVPDASSVTNKEVGQIIYDAADDQFKGVDSSGNFQALSVGVNANAVVSGGTERIERIQFGGGASAGIATSACTSSPCVIASQSGSWVGTTSVTKNATGQYTVAVNSGIFGAPPSCTCTIGLHNVATGGFGDCGATSSTSISVNARNTAGALADNVVTIICMGPQP